VPTLDRLDVHSLRAVVTTFRDAVHAHAGGLNRLNVYPVPDGDTGTNMARTLEAVVAEMESAEETLDATCDAISHGSLMGARGNSGVILSQIMRGIASTMKEQAETSGARFAEALTSAAAGAYRAVLKPIEGTILTVVRESADAARAAAADGASLVEVISAAREAGRDALERTPEMLPVLADAGVVDAGGAGYLLLLDSAMHVVDGSPLPEPGEPDPVILPLQSSMTITESRVGGADTVDVADQRFEVMYLCELDDERIEDFKQGWGQIGDSIVVVGGEGMWNCHVHTNDIGAAIEVALELGGRPSRIRVTDLFDEVEAEHERREAEMTQAERGAPHVPSRAGSGQPRVTTAVVAVSSGPGLADLFSALRVQGIVSGGQTLNPSTAELLDVVEHVNADQVVILPNNSNIIPVAEQIDALTSKVVKVVATRTMPQALAALISYDPEADAVENVASMSMAADAVRTGEVTQAVRSSRSDVGPVSEGDWIGIVKGDGIAVVGTDPLDVCSRLVDQLLGDDGELVTIITGIDADDQVVASLLSALRDRTLAPEVEVHHGGQPLYPYLFGVE
jgi:DAK2 domain fusion protein YloV